LAYSIAPGTIWGGWKIIETTGLRVHHLASQLGSDRASPAKAAVSIVDVSVLTLV